MGKGTTISIGQLAKQANVSVRTLQYYDQIGLLKPSSLSEGGRRLYTSKDMTILHQILTLKSLGFSLEDIKERIIPVHDTNDVLHLLTQQSDILNNQIEKLQRLHESVQLLKEEIQERQDVDWYKYSTIVKSIHENNEYTWVIKHLDKELLTSIIHRDKEEKIPFCWWHDVLKDAIELQEKGLRPDSEAGQKLAENWWQYMQLYSKGDQHLLGKMVDFYESADEWPEAFRQVQKQAQQFIEHAIGYYLEKNKIQVPFYEGREEN